MAAAAKADEATPVDFWRSAGGRFQFRVRETHVRDRLAPLLSRGADGVVKLDLVLRGLASPVGADGQLGCVPEWITWEDLHDLCRDPKFYGDNHTLKRKWVSNKLLQLERLGLVRRDHERGPRPLITVLRDDGSRDVFDDPGASSDSYVTFLGTIIAFGRLRSWKSPQLTAYIACMIAERYARSDAVFSKAVDLGQRPLGGGLWYRPLRWFADVDERRLEHHVRVPFSERTLKRGIQALKREGLLVTERIAEDPRSGRRFEKGPRVLFHNGFHDVRPGAKLRPSFPTRFRRSSSRAAT